MFAAGRELWRAKAGNLKPTQTNCNSIVGGKTHIIQSSRKADGRWFM